MTGNEIQAYFKRLDTAIRPIRNSIDGLQKIYKRIKADKERLVREAEAKRLQDEADKLAREQREREAATAKSLAEAAEVEKAAEEVEKAQGKADRADRKARAPDAHLSRTRGEHGTQTSLRQREVMTVVDPGAIDWDTLGQYVDDDCRDKAIRSFKAAGGTKLTGVEWTMEDTLR
jgi:hypothetical protein